MIASIKCHMLAYDIDGDLIPNSQIGAEADAAAALEDGDSH